MADNVDRQGTNTRHNGWNKVTNPSVNWMASKTSGWTADSFSGGLTVDFAALDPNYVAGARAVRCYVYRAAAVGAVYWRKGGDSNISNTPSASTEYSHLILADDTGTATNSAQVVLWLSSTGTVDFAVTPNTIDLYVAFPLEYLL